MRLRSFAAVATILAVIATPGVASADATFFLGRALSPSERVVRGFAAGMSLLIVGFELEYASSGENFEEHDPSLKTTSGNVFVQTPSLSGFQLYGTTGVGYYRERLGEDEETSSVFNSGAGAKISLAGPLRARIDYRFFNLRGNPRHPKVHRIYAGLNLAF